jgi:hypothetical protein
MTAEQALQERVFDRLAAIPTEASRIRFITRLRLMSPSTVQRLDEAVGAQVRIDLKKAENLAEAAVTIANKLADKESQGYALRAKANAFAYRGQNRQASELLMRAGGLFEEAGKIVEAGRTLSTRCKRLERPGKSLPPPTKRCGSLASRSMSVTSFTVKIAFEKRSSVISRRMANCFPTKTWRVSSRRFTTLRYA